jgi:hypothetical protein
VNDAVFQLLSTLRSWSPASRQWRQFLHSLPIDPDALPQPIMEPGERDFIVCGAPRTGTSLLAAMLVQPPRVYTVMDAWDGMRLPPAELFSSLRSRIREGKLAAGKLDIEGLMASGEVRWSREGYSTVRLGVSDTLRLGVKWPIFWRYLPYLPNTRFIVTLRDPYSVIASFRRHGGRLRMGLDYDTAFNRQMNGRLQSATSELALRRVMFFDYVHERILPFLSKPNVLAVRYERWHSEPDALRGEIGEFLGAQLQPGPAKIRRPVTVDLPARERALIQRECRTATALGYSL